MRSSGLVLGALGGGRVRCGTVAPLVSLSYDDARVPVRDDITEAHRGVWAGIAAAGTWWTGAERVAIAAQTRRARTCDLCARRKAALSPYSINESHDAGVLSAVVVDTVHRIASDPGRLSKRLLDDFVQSGLTDGHYVELIGVVVRTITVDTFCRGIGVVQHELPTARPGELGELGELGEPSRRRPTRAKDLGAWVPMLPGLTPNVARALSLVPPEANALKPLAAAQYVPVDQILDVSVDRTITRGQMELLAAKVSSINACFY